MGNTNVRRIVFPKPCVPSVDGRALAGLAEWLVQSLSSRGVLDTTEGCELVQAVMPRLLAIAGALQEGASLDVTEAQWSLLKQFAAPCVSLPPEIQLPLATCLIALYTALVPTEGPR